MEIAKLSLTPPEGGNPPTYVEKNPIVCVISGDGVAEATPGNGIGITAAAIKVLDAAVALFKKGTTIKWFHLPIGQCNIKTNYPTATAADIDALSADDQRRLLVPDEAIAEIRKYGIVLAGPLFTTTWSKFWSPEEWLHRHLDLSVEIHPILDARLGSDYDIYTAKPKEPVLIRADPSIQYLDIEVEASSPDRAKLSAVLAEMLGMEERKGTLFFVQPIDGDAVTAGLGVAVKMAKEDGARFVHVVGPTLPRRPAIPALIERAVAEIIKKETTARPNGPAAVRQTYLEKDFLVNDLLLPGNEVVVCYRNSIDMLRDLYDSQVEVTHILTTGGESNIVHEMIRSRAMEGHMGATAYGSNSSPSDGGRRPVFFSSTTPALISGDNAGLANPIGMIRAGAAMLGQLGMTQAKAKINFAVAKYLEDIRDRGQSGEAAAMRGLATLDILQSFPVQLAGSQAATTSAVADMIIANLTKAF